MTIRDKNLDAIDESIRKFHESGYDKRMNGSDVNGKHGTRFQTVHLESRAKMVGVWPEQRAKK